MKALGTALLLLSFPAFAQNDYDLLLEGGHVIDPKSATSAVLDVALHHGKIAAVATDIPASEAYKVVDVSGLYVTPGLVDIHVHAFVEVAPGAEETRSVYPDSHALRSGVTTVVDAGSSGWRTFPAFKRSVIDRSRTRVLAMLNVVGYGMDRRDHEQDASDMEPAVVAEWAKRYPGLIVGIKTAHYDGPEWVAVERAVEAGTLAGLPVMVDFGEFRPERPFAELVLSKLREGDIYTHMYLGAVPWLDDSGRVRPFFFEARKRGVLFDVGHGGGSFLFRYAVPAVRQGFSPDSISTDLHGGSMNAGMKDMTNVMSKFLNLGMSLEEVVARSTWNPSRQIRREDLGHLGIGAPGDVAVLRMEAGSFGFVDVSGGRLRGDKKLVCELTLRDGKVVYDLNGMTREDWDSPNPPDPAGEARWYGIRSTELKAPAPGRPAP